MLRLDTKIKYVIMAMLLLLAVITAFPGGASNAYAVSPYSDVLDDLRKDKNFTVDKYPVNTKDYGLQVIQVAESTDGELFIYVYQPGGKKLDLRASSINIAKSDNDTAQFKNYKLNYLNSVGVFYKYRVQGFTLSGNAIRYYNISNILRPYDKILDAPPASGQTVSETPFAVGQLWTVCTVGDTVTYTNTETEVIEITQKYVGYINYPDGVNLGWTITGGSTSSHFVAFSTDKPIEKLISADVSFCERLVNYQYCCSILHTHGYGKYFNYRYGDKVQHDPDPVTVTYKDKASNVGGNGIKPANKYTWDRIQTSSEFLAAAEANGREIKSEYKDEIKNTNWVLNFYETPIQAQMDGGIWTTLISPWVMLWEGDMDMRHTEVSDVMILRLKFETYGETYNLGVIDNKQTGNNKPINPGNADGGSSLPWWGWLLIGFGVVAVILILICALVPGAAPVIGRGLLAFGKAVLWVILLPFRLIGELFKAIGNAIERRKATAATSTTRKTKTKKAGKRK